MFEIGLVFNIAKQAERMGEDGFGGQGFREICEGRKPDNLQKRAAVGHHSEFP